MEIKTEHPTHIVWLLTQYNTIVVEALPNRSYCIAVIYEKAHVKGIGVGRITIFV